MPLSSDTQASHSKVPEPLPNEQVQRANTAAPMPSNVTLPNQPVSTTSRPQVTATRENIAGTRSSSNNSRANKHVTSSVIMSNSQMSSNQQFMHNSPNLSNMPPPISIYQGNTSNNMDILPHSSLNMPPPPTSYPSHHAQIGGRYHSSSSAPTYHQDYQSGQYSSSSSRPTYMSTVGASHQGYHTSNRSNSISTSGAYHSKSKNSSSRSSGQKLQQPPLGNPQYQLPNPGQYVNEQGKVFTVNHLVNPNKQHQQLQPISQGNQHRKTASKRQSQGNSRSKQAIKDPASRYDMPSPKTSSKSRSSSSKSSPMSKLKPSYSAESLISVQSVGMSPLDAPTMLDFETDKSTNWNAEIPHIQFNSISPSPAMAASNLFQDIPPFDLGTGLFSSEPPPPPVGMNPPVSIGSSSTSGSKNPFMPSTSEGNPVQAKQSYQSSKCDMPSSSANSGNVSKQSYGTNQGYSSHSHGHCHSHPHHGSQSSSSMRQDQYLGPSLIDNNFFPLPTLTPPNTEDHYPGFMYSGSGSGVAPVLTRAVQDTQEVQPVLIKDINKLTNNWDIPQPNSYRQQLHWQPYTQDRNN